MFCVISDSQVEELKVLDLLSEFRLCIRKGPLTKEKHRVIVICDEFVENDLQKAEWMMMECYHQVRWICPVCEFKTPNEKTCGDLTFHGRIHPAF